VPAPQDLTGQEFGRAKVVSFSHIGKNGQYHWNCVCVCGTPFTACAWSLKSGNTKSCGCYRREFGRKVGESRSTHGKAHLREYDVWISMKQRCDNPKQQAYRDYGGRGIEVCARWRESFPAFMADMGECPRGFSLDRINNDGNYEPSNCRWATRSEQRINQRPRKRKPT
jgi:hypothetical protein